MIFGYFVIEGMELKRAVNYLFWAGDGESDDSNLKRHSSWHARELAVGPNNLYIRYNSDQEYREGEGEQVITGFISGQLIDEAPLIGSAPLRGDFHDLNAQRNECRGEFYAERIQCSSDAKEHAHIYSALMYERMENFQRLIPDQAGE
jgi:hypothetical protein